MPKSQLVMYTMICLAEISSFKEQVDALQEHDQLVEILVRLLCAVPEVIRHIASTEKLPKKCAILCIERKEKITDCGQ